MNLIYKSIDVLIPYKNNPRNNKDAIKYVKESIKEFGFKVPIIIDKNNVIIAGHTRYEASKELKIKELPCIIADDLTEEQIKEYRLIDNKTQEYSIWDYGKIFDELDKILSIDMNRFGFESDLDSLGSYDYSGADDIDNYEEPSHPMYRCPHCQHTDRKIHFKKVQE